MDYVTDEGTVHAVENLNMSLKHGETLGMVGKSGCGKSTTGRALIRIHEATAGQVILKYNLTKFKEMRKKMQIQKIYAQVKLLS